MYVIFKVEYFFGYFLFCNGIIGSYRYDDSLCDVYYRCDNGIVIVVKCLENYNLNIIFGNCELNYLCNWYFCVWS